MQIKYFKMLTLHSIYYHKNVPRAMFCRVFSYNYFSNNISKLEIIKRKAIDSSRLHLGHQTLE